ncbi:hypothetical protein FSW04_18235 [Baekduia soli]|uniref:Uncharacterized protein n=1 Tax=Baekduia soli TaxID=496014 RepID=A0A5B8UCR7_9ACTN|nr:hypothetical protein FSW04_18235 [Baekduia soli]
MRWKLVGLAGLAGVAATGAIVARHRRAQRDYDPDELRDRLHRRLAEAVPDGATAPPAAPGAPPPA